MLYIKIMSDEESHDTYLGKNYSLIQIGDKDRIQFGEFGSLFPNPSNAWDHNGAPEVLIIIRENSTEQETYALLGNVYIMNENGKTIATRIKRDTGGEVEGYRIAQ
ncbi:MAG: hypothetical protein JO253_07990 [Alphaproteobacteria bacterium]|nr:hypothetical protein [Alphaproteobacteria bacterium]